MVHFMCFMFYFYVFFLISWCGNLAKTYGSCRVAGDLSKTLCKLCVSTKLLHKEIMWNYGNLCSDLTEFLTIYSLTFWIKTSTNIK